MFLYPLAITLILLGLCGAAFKNRRCVYVCTTAFTLIAAVFDFLAALPATVLSALKLHPVLDFMKQYVPLFELGLGWLLPAAVGFVIGLVVMFATRNKTETV